MQIPACRPPSFVSAWESIHIECMQERHGDAVFVYTGLPSSKGAIARVYGDTTLVVCRATVVLIAYEAHNPPVDGSGVSPAKRVESDKEMAVLRTRREFASVIRPTRRDTDCLDTRVHTLCLLEILGVRVGPNVCAASGSGGVKQLSKQEKERQRKERQKERKRAEVESNLRNALADLSQQGLR